MTPPPDAPLATALSELVATAQLAGADPGAARAEGEALAATVAEPARGAYLDWAAQTGPGRGAEDFTRAAGRGRRWRSVPTPLLTGLAAGGNRQAVAYARALARVCSAATALGEPTPRVIGNAATATSAQLAAFGPPAPTARVEPKRPVGLDLEGLDDWSPGAFAGIGPTPRPPAPDPPLEAGEDLGATTGHDPEPPAPEAVEVPARSLEELLSELDGLIGSARKASRHSVAQK